MYPIVVLNLFKICLLAILFQTKLSTYLLTIFMVLSNIYLFLIERDSGFMCLRFLIISMLLFVSGTTVLSGQSLTQQVIVPVAGLQLSTKVHYAQTVGEVAVEIIGCTEYVFTQGFQQPGIKVVKENPPPGNGIKVYPNPVSDFVTIEMFGDETRTLLIDFIGISGTVNRSEKFEFNDQYWFCQTFSVEKYSRGLFFIRIKSIDGLINRTFKIEKL